MNNSEMVSVPRELTPEMREAFHASYEAYEDGRGECPDSQWTAMLRTAPKPAEPGLREPLPEIDLTPQRLEHAEKVITQLNGELERLAEANLHHRNLQIEADDLIKSLREELTEIRQAARAVLSARDSDDYPHGHPGHWHEVRGQWDSSGAPCQDCAAYDRLEMLAGSAKPSVPKYPRIEIVRAHKHTCASCKEGVDHGPCDCGAIIGNVAVKAKLVDAQLIEIARKAAVDSIHRYFYMPTTPEAAKSWLPHRWVIEAMRSAMECKP
ncbi:hypothetical protein LU646_05195 [Pseudomonas alloputida]|uniref:hypothetical protein n=1 Tax=Pseudomonas putida group TaxID=136845 RepID=UPI001E5F64C1|nr:MULTISPECIES: hypothetical protein [Pseudomonas putida group]MCE1017256.1 hypothetical protein [Pseudomonas monteilii]MCE1057283.1 hypothetical protein [Pseudomonas alloputida]